MEVQYFSYLTGSYTQCMYFCVILSGIHESSCYPYMIFMRQCWVPRFRFFLCWKLEWSYRYSKQRHQLRSAMEGIPGSSNAEEKEVRPRMNTMLTIIIMTTTTIMIRSLRFVYGNKGTDLQTLQIIVPKGINVMIIHHIHSTDRIPTSFLYVLYGGRRGSCSSG